MGARKRAVEDEEDHRVGSGFVQRGGMKRDAEGHADEFVRVGILEGDRPGPLALDTPATAGGEASQTADGVSKGYSRAEGVGGQQTREFAAAEIPDGNQ